MPPTGSDADLAKSGAFPLGSVPGSAGDSPRKRSIWLNGDILSCACPKCQSPMSIRLWLRAADCWRCGTSLELSEEQEQEARQLLLEQGVQSPAVPINQGAMNQGPMNQGPMNQGPENHGSEKPASPAAIPVHRTLIAVDAEQVADERVPVEYEVVYEDRFKDLPAWLASIVIHLVLVILLGLWMIRPEEKIPPLTLACEMNRLREEGDARQMELDSDALEFEAPDKNPIEPIQDIATLAATASLASLLPSKELSSQIPELDANLPPPPPPRSASGQAALLDGRNPQLRAQYVKHEGGTSETEAAVARGLMWLARHQNADGRWSLNKFHLAGECKGECGSRGGQSDTAGTALALFAFLGAGQSHVQGAYHETVAKGLRWLMDQQLPDGDLRGRGIGRMYAHGQASIALCEAYALSHDSQVRAPAQRAIDFIVKAQHREGGWRYSPGEPGDTSVVGWQLMALRSAQMASLTVPETAIARAMKFLDSVQTERDIGVYGYMPGDGPSPVMTAEALLMRQYSGWGRGNRTLESGVEWLAKSPPKRAATPNMYYWYYATQVMHHMGGQEWEDWNTAMRSILVDTQETKGHKAGSWAPRGGHDRDGGRVYMTALAVCTLEVYYRHIPLYRLKAVERKTEP
jgi:hypothetical protein